MAYRGVSVPRMNSEIHEDELAVRELLSEPSGFERYAAEKMPEFIQVVRDYEGFVRDVIQVTNVSSTDVVRVDEEVFVVYSKDVDSMAATISRMGEVPTQIIKGETVKVTFFQLATPRLTITQWELDTQPFDLLKRTQEKAGQAIARIEDEEFLRTVDLLIKLNPSQRVFQAGEQVTKAALLSLAKIFSRNDVSFSGYLMNPATYTDILLWGEDDLDDQTQKTVLETGQLPTIWGGQRIITGIVVPEKKVYGLAPKEVLGRMPILRDITLDMQRIPQTQDKEVLAYEYIGLFVHSHLAVARLDLGVTA